MAVRAQVYQGLLWQQVIREQKLESGARLPPLLLLVLYNGAQRWRSPTEVTELIGLQPDSRLWYWQPQARYYLLDIGAVVQDALLRQNSLVALLFRFERSCSSAELQQLIDEVVGWFRRHGDYPELRDLFSEIVSQAMWSAGKRARVPEDLLNMKSNISSNIAAWAEHRFAESMARGEAIGLAKGKVKGESIGLAKGKAESLVSLLRSRFGALPPSIRKRIQRATLASIERWFKRALDAQDLPSVFGRSR